MKLLVIGSGGREHALAWRLTQNPKVQCVYVAPGNAGTAREDGLVNVNITAIPELLKFAQDEKIHLTVVGPEAPLAAGVVDAFQAAGLRIFGPSQRAAQLESSKDFAKQFMVRHKIPTAKYATFTSAAEARAYVEREGAPIVIKADGLAAGKGVVVAMTLGDALEAIDKMFATDSPSPPAPLPQEGEGGRRAAQAGRGEVRVVIEEFMEGEEASFICMCDGVHALPFASSQDHKRIFDGDQGPNTGGMGAYSPAPVVTPEVHARTMREVIMPTLRGMAAEGAPFTGFLYAGLMIDENGKPRVVEFNARMGDPETQPIMMRLKSDFLTLIEHAIDGKLNQIEAEWDRRAALGVVMAAANYPEAPTKGDEITGLPKPADDARVFHAGSADKDGKVVTSGGRVLCVTALGDTVKIAQQRAYQLLEPIRFNGMQYRRDIGYRAIGRRP
ncbi:MAG: phosphoribosylamine--glycine ligase [Betaproteobacteria bacterium]|nr:phosphoribosylamine--glycine ligase [Betaproteobacteria bacterium]